jgi:hypothetical protein
MLEEIIEKYGDEFADDVFPKLPVSSYGNLESMVLYCFIRDIKPKVVAEIGTEVKSRSSFIIESALQKNRTGSLHIMADLTGKVERAAENLMIDFDANIKVLSGRIQDTYSKQDWSEVDFLFIDADHPRSFAKWYLDNLIPLLKEGTYVHIHDIDLYANWKGYEVSDNEAGELLDRHMVGKLCLNKLFWLFDYSYNPYYKEALEYFEKRYSFVGKQTLDEPYKNGASYWSTT